MQTIKASVFKAKCLSLMDQVNQTGEEIVITKNGEPVSRLLPFRTSAKSLYGLHRGFIASEEGIVDPVDVLWDAER